MREICGKKDKPNTDNEFSNAISSFIQKETFLKNETGYCKVQHLKHK